MYELVIIDDEEKILDGISNLFPWSAIGFKIAGTFSKASQAIDFVQHHPVHVVMSDIKMPEMDGITLAKELSCFPNIKIVFFSSFQNYEYFRSAIKYHAVDYLLKPIKYEELVNCFTEIKNILDKERCKDGTLEVSKGYYDKIIDTVYDYLKQDFRNASLKKAATQVGLSVNYLSKIFKEKAGIGFADCLMKIRMEKAREYLEDIHYKSYEIASCVGYDNPKNFSRAFKAYYQMSPTEYRNKKMKDR